MNQGAMPAYTPGPWRWEYNATHKSVQLCGGRPLFDKTVMGFARWGMSGAQPRFMGLSDRFRILHNLASRRDWITPFAGREHHASWCAEVTHPDALLMAAAPELLEALQKIVFDWDGEPEDMFQAKSAIAKATGQLAALSDQPTRQEDA